MGKKIEGMVSPEINNNTLTIELFGPGMTAFHKVGLAGLWMTLEALEKENDGVQAFKNGSGSWEGTRNSVTLRWNGEPEAFFQTLFENSFKIDKNGLFWFPALGIPTDHIQHASILQEAILGSFLQHGQTRKSDPSQKPGGHLKFEINDSSVVLKFHRVTSYSHQKDENFNPTAINPIAGLLYPGGAVRHIGLGQVATALAESPGHSLALRFGIVGVIYFKISSHNVGIKPRYCLVLPDISDLEQYAQARRTFVGYGIDQLLSSGTADAGFRVLAQLEATRLLEGVSASVCQVISFGTVPWSKQQKTRVRIETVRIISDRALRIYRACTIYFKTRFIKPKDKEPFWNVPQMLDIAAKNLIGGRKWWEGFADEVDDKICREHIINYEKYEQGGLKKMVENQETLPNGPERTFVLACQEAWRRRLGQISDKAKRQEASFYDQANREFTRICISFSRCKNADSLREAVIDFWSRGGGSLRTLQDGWHEILTLFDENNWRKGRDLALLALVSYKPATKEEESVLEVHETKGDE